MKYKLPLKALWYDLKNLKSYQILSCDYKKYDGTIKMVIAGSTEARNKLNEYLDQLHKEEKVFYGIHASDRALMTCLLHSGSESEVHFVDAADGGYALAAKQLKGQMKLAKS